jgi:flagellar motor protein MotB
MEEPDSADHLNSSLTDLMASLMVIFILLLLVFVSSKAGTDPAVAELLLRRLRDDLNPMGFSDKAMTRDRNVILVIVPDRLMNFETGKSALQPDGEQFLKRYIPHFAAVICSDQFRSSIESIVVEGHTDTQPFPGQSAEASQSLNLKLSQDRSMEVVKSALANLQGMNTERGCFLEKLSASGRGEQEPEATLDDSRRVIFKIRVKVVEADAMRVAVH